MSNPPVADQEKTEAFVEKVLGDTSATMITLLAAIGDRLGLFKDLAARGPATSADLAARNRVNERYAREWLGAMACAGYLTYDPASGRFTLPAEHVPVLAQESGPFFFGGAHQMIPPLIGILDQVTEAFRKGGGVPFGAYGQDWWDGMERFTSGWFENVLLPVWIPAMPDVQAKLERGVRVADVGCGRGRALIKLAEAFPKSRFVGYDIFPPSVETATARAKTAGVADRVTFKQADVARGLPEPHDVITTFDVIHDAADPLGMLKVIRKSLPEDGVYVCLDINCSDRLEQNVGPLGSLFYGFSTLYCMTTSLGAGGVGLGALGFHEPKVRELCEEAGFGAVRRVPLEDPFNILYEIRP